MIGTERAERDDQWLFDEEGATMRIPARNSRNTLRRAANAVSHKVRIAASVMQAYRETIARKPPETFALLGGRLDDPFTITEFRYCPPRKQNGKYDRSSMHVNVDEEYMNFVVDEEFRPAGKYMLGVWHSHPGSSRSLSVGDEDRNEGDMVFFQNCLRNDDSPGRNWRYLIAPITTFEPNGSDIIDVWIVTLDEAMPAPANYVVVPGPLDPLRMLNPDPLEARPLGEELLSDGLPIEAITRQMECYHAGINWAENCPDMEHCDREAIIRGLRRLRQRELDDIWRGLHPLGRYLEDRRRTGIVGPDEGDSQVPE